MKWILVGIVCACAVAALAIASFFCGSKTLEVELELKWTLSEGKYQQIPVNVGDILYGDGNVEVRIEELGEEKREGEAPNITITRTARGVVLRGEENVREGMSLRISKEGFVAIPEACAPLIRVERLIWK